MPAESELNRKLIDAYHAFMRDGTVEATARDAIKDARSTIMEVFFGKGERGSEPGMPLNPLFHDIVQARKAHGSANDAGPSSSMEKGPAMPSGDGPHPTPSQVIANPQAYLAQSQSQGQGNAMAMDATPDRGNADPTPSQVIANPQAYLPDQTQQHGHEHHHGHGR